MFDSVYLDNYEVVIHRKGHFISFDEYNSMKETNYLQSSPKSKEVLLRSLKDKKVLKSKN